MKMTCYREEGVFMSHDVCKDTGVAPRAGAGFAFILVVFILLVIIGAVAWSGYGY
jgi:uncharacterized protein (TIGR01732 family)